LYEVILSGILKERKKRKKEKEEKEEQVGNPKTDKLFSIP